MSDGSATTFSQIEDLSVDFRTSAGRLHALRDVSLAVPRGEIVGIVGEFGCGKSTLINAVIGLLAANAEIVAGRILLQRRRPPDDAAPTSCGACAATASPRSSRTR